MKTISIMVPCYNEQENVEPLYGAIVDEFHKNLPKYNYELLFIDNRSQDKTRDKISEICKSDKNVKAIFNAKNFGQLRSPYYGALQTTGDCTILMAADFQDPVEMIHKFVAEWESGYKIVVGIKRPAKENGFFYFMRFAYYKIIKRIATTEQIEHFTGFGLYDKGFIQVLRDLKDPIPYMRGIVSELGYERKDLMFDQAKRRHGKTSNNFFSLYDVAMLGITSYSKTIVRAATMLGFLMAAASTIIGFVFFVLKLIYWNQFPAGYVPIIILVSFIGSVQLVFLGLIGEYVLNINTRAMNRPLVIEEKRINF